MRVACIVEFAGQRSEVCVLFNCIWPLVATIAKMFSVSSERFQYD
jgi:hypothetical protein